MTPAEIAQLVTCACRRPQPVSVGVNTGPFASRQYCQVCKGLLSDESLDVLALQEEQASTAYWGRQGS